MFNREFQKRLFEIAFSLIDCLCAQEYFSSINTWHVNGLQYISYLSDLCRTFWRKCILKTTVTNAFNRPTRPTQGNVFL